MNVSGCSSPVYLRYAADASSPGALRPGLWDFLVADLTENSPTFQYRLPQKQTCFVYAFVHCFLSLYVHSVFDCYGY